MSIDSLHCMAVSNCLAAVHSPILAKNKIKLISQNMFMYITKQFILFQISDKR